MWFGPDRGSTTPLGSTTPRREDRGGWSREGGMDERCVEGGRSWTRSVGGGARRRARERDAARDRGRAGRAQAGRVTDEGCFLNFCARV